MIWVILPLLAAYLAAAWFVHRFGLSFVGDSPAGRCAVPVVAVLWLPCIGFLLLIAVVALVEHAFDEATGWMGRAERDG